MNFQHKDISVVQNLLLGKSKHFVIFSHTHPDGDALGSGLALLFFLQSLGHKADFILPDRFPDFLAWMPGTSQIIISDNSNKNMTQSLIEKADCFVFVDLNSISRLDKLAEMITPNLPKACSLLIDHHIDPDNSFTYKYHNINASSTSELLFELIDLIGKKDLITKQMAECLYVGVMTDTGSFSYSCNNPYTYDVVKYFISLGIDAALIHQLVYNTFTEDKIRLLGYSLSEKLKVYPTYGGAFISLNVEELKKYEYRVGDTEGLVNYTLSIKNIQFGALLTEMEGFVKISFRSIGDINVSEIAKRNFQGGGHKNAAGAYYYGTLEDACKIIDSIIKTQLNII